jgi:hypothetical protein
MLEEPSAVDQYEKVKLKQEQMKAFSTLVTLGCIVFLIVVGIICSVIELDSIIPKVIKNTAYDCFNLGDPFPSFNGMNDAENGYVIISVNAQNQKVAMDQLRVLYHKLSKKSSTKKVDKISVVVYAPDTQTMLLTSNIWIKEIKAVNWYSINSYDDFIDKANITLN